MRLLLYLVLALPLVGAYTLLGLGITVIYQASRVLNLAHGAMAMAGAYVTYEAFHVHLPLPLAVLLGVAAGAVLGLLLERFFVRRLRRSGATTQTVGTVAVLTLTVAVVSLIFGSLPVNAPQLFPDGVLHLGSGFVPYNQLGVFPVAMLLAALLFALFRFTDIGLAMRGAAVNRRGAGLRGINPDSTAALAWVLGGALAAAAGILLAGASELDPYTISLGVLPAFVAALIGGLESMPGVVVGAAVIGLVQGLVPAIALIPSLSGFFGSQGVPALALGVVAMVAMAFRGARLSGATAAQDTL
ncbi:MAG: branched-chain amino acid ABC transporter permease [Candidatus Dormibacteria bacterium]